MKLDVLLRRYFSGRPRQDAAGDGPPGSDWGRFKTDTQV